MKVFIIAAVTADGFIGQDADIFRISHAAFGASGKVAVLLFEHVVQANAKSVAYLE